MAIRLADVYKNAFKPMNIDENVNIRDYAFVEKC